MSKYKVIFHNTLYIAAFVMGLHLLFNPLNIKAQDSIVKTTDYYVKIDTIHTYDTTYIIDTLIRPKTIVRIDTISLIPERDKTLRKFEGSIGLAINQLALTYWASGGESNASCKLNADFKYTLNRKKFCYVTSGIFAYGVSGYIKSKRFEKTEDRCEISMTISNNNQKHLTFTSMGTLKTQFTNGYSYPNESEAISKFFAPAYLTISLGYTYTINKYLSIYMSPVAGKMTFVLDQTLANKGAFGVEAGYWNIINGDSTWVSGKNFLGELGINILVKYSQDFAKNISIFSKLNLYNNYIDANISNRWNIDVDWESGLKFVISKRISTIINIHLVYDDNVRFTVTEVVNGVEVTKQKPILQFKESLGISFLFNFAK